MTALRDLSVVAILTIILTQACAAHGPLIPPGTDTYYRGNISTGTRFQVNIGDSVTKAAHSPAATYLGEITCNYEIDYVAGCKKSERFLFYDINEPNRKGELYLRIRDKRIEAIIWRSAAGRVEF